MSHRTPSPVLTALTRARRVLTATTPVAKTIWGSPAGKKRIADRLASLLPPHETYVEPFAGSAAVLFAKAPAATEVINDADAEIAEAYRLVQKLSPGQLGELKKLDWTGDAGRFKRLIDAAPTGDVSRLHRFLYLTHFSYGKMRGRSFSPNLQGIEATTPDRVARDQPRLKGVKVYSGDYARVIEKYDGKDTVFFLDPPYAGYDADVGEGKFDEARFFEVLKAIKGKWVMTYGIRGKLPAMLRKAGFSVQQIRTPRTIRAMRNVGGPTMLTQLLVANFDLGDAWKRSAGAKPAASAEKPAPSARGARREGAAVRHVRRLVPLRQAHRAAHPAARHLRGAVRRRRGRAVREGAVGPRDPRRPRRRRRVPAPLGEGDDAGDGRRALAPVSVDRHRG
jgi:site-specific DNA-adenine methylase